MNGYIPPTEGPKTGTQDLRKIELIKKKVIKQLPKKKRESFMELEFFLIILVDKSCEKKSISVF